MERAFTFAVSGTYLTVTLTYYASHGASSPWYTTTLSAFDLTNSQTTIEHIEDAITMVDQKVKAAYNLSGTLTSAVGDRLGVREGI